MSEFNDKHIAHFGIESSILSVIINNPDRIEVAIARQLMAEHFQNPHTQYLYKCMLKIRDKAKVANREYCFDVTSMIDAVKRLGPEVEKHFLEQAGGLEFLNNLQSGMVCDVKSFEYYLDSLFQRYIRIQTFRAAKKIQELAIDSEDATIGEFLGEIDSIVGKLENLHTESDIIRLGDSLKELMDEFRANKGQKINGLFVTGMPRLMKILNGLRRKEMIVLFARPKTGKSGLFMNIASDIACGQNIPVLYIDTEMSADEQQSRIIAKMADVPEWNIVNGSFLDDPDMKAKVEMAEALLESAPFYYLRASGYTPEQVVGACERFVEHNVGYMEVNGKKKTKECLIIYDWLKVPENSSSTREKEYQQLGDIATKLNDRVAKGLDVPLICGAQANRMGAGKEATGNAADFAQQFLGDSDRILRFCTCLIWLRWLKTEEAEKVAVLPAEKFFNQMIHVLDQRKGPKFLEGIPLHFIGDRIKYIEKEPINLDKIEEEAQNNETAEDNPVEEFQFS